MRTKRGKRAVRIAVAVPLIIATGFLLGQVPPETWMTVGERAAVMSLGLRQPEDGIRYWTGLGEEDTDATVSTNVKSRTTVPLGTARTAAVATEAGTEQPASGGGKVLTEQLSSGSDFVNNVAILNKTGKTVDIAASLKHKPALSFSAQKKEPQVLITHTHTTECYLNRDTGVYQANDATRTADASRNVVAVGESLCAELRTAGIGVIHDTAIHDNPYTGAYDRSKKAIQNYLKKYPSICVVLDIHRDAIYPSDSTRVKPTAVINGKKAAQVMIVVGMLNSKAVPNSHTAENLSLAVRLQQTLHRSYNGLTRPLYLVNARYNQQLTNGSLLIEVGTDANTLDEAVYAGQLVGKGLADTLTAL